MTPCLSNPQRECRNLGFGSCRRCCERPEMVKFAVRLILTGITTFTDVDSRYGWSLLRQPARVDRDLWDSVTAGMGAIE